MKPQKIEKENRKKIKKAFDKLRGIEQMYNALNDFLIKIEQKINETL